VSDLILFGAGTSGRWVVRERAARGETAPVAFADNDKKKWGTTIEGIPVHSPGGCSFAWPDAVWMVTIIHSIHRREVLDQVKKMGVETIPIWPYLRENTGQMPREAFLTVSSLLDDDESREEWGFQRTFRHNPKYSDSGEYCDIREVYFPSFISHRDDEVFVDCGAAEGDTIKAFLDRWPKFKWITAFEPDFENFEKLQNAYHDRPDEIRLLNAAVADFHGPSTFVGTGDQSSHLAIDGDCFVPVMMLDNPSLWNFEGDYNPTFIKMDIEGSELEAIWGARETIRKHSPVLAICAYHTSDHIWQIPLLINAIQPAYRLYLRRYAEGALETVWYAVPPERIL